MGFKKLAFVLAFVSLTTLAAGSELGSIFSAAGHLPKCALTCYESMTKGDSALCSMSDPTCICTNDAFTKAVSDCVQTSCLANPDSGPNASGRGELLEAHRVWVEACRVTPRSQKPLLFIPLITMIPAWLAIWTRLYSRWSTLGRWEVDDWLMVPVGVLFTAYGVLSQFTQQQFFGVDTWTLETAQITQAMKQYYICDIFNILSLTLTKISMLWFYTRIFPTKTFRYIVYGTIVFVIIPNVFYLFFKIFQCNPIHYVWDGWLFKGYEDVCFNVKNISLVQAGLSLMQDLLIFFLPIVPLYRLKLDSRPKLGIMIMFGLGILIVITAVVHAAFASQFGRITNPTWDYVSAFISIAIELSVTILVACLPALWVLAIQHFPQILRSMNDPKKNEKHGGKTRMGFGSKSRPQFSAGEAELGLALGLRTRGEVRTLITCRRDSVSSSEGEWKSDEFAGGIRVDTVTLITMSRVNDKGEYD